MNPPAFQFYAADFLADAAVMAMSYEERGVYITLLALGWREGSIPADRTAQARLLKLSRARLDRLWPALASKFTPGESAGQLVNPRLERERHRQAAWREKSAKGGRSKRQPPGNHAWHGAGKGGTSLQSSPSSSSASSEEKTETPPPLHGFNQFKAAYPRREAWADAERAWRQVKAAEHLARILADIARRLATQEWQPELRERRQYIPLPASYLRKRRWEDEAPGINSDGPGGEDDPYAGQPHLWDCSCGEVHEGVRGQPRPPCPNAESARGQRHG